MDILGSSLRVTFLEIHYYSITYIVTRYLLQEVHLIQDMIRSIKSILILNLTNFSHIDHSEPAYYYRSFYSCIEISQNRDKKTLLQFLNSQIVKYI